MILLVWLACGPQEVPPALARAGSPCAAEEIPVRWGSYAVEGDTRNALQDSIWERGPGGGLVGITKTTVDYACTRTDTLDLRVDVQIEVSVPSWRPPRGVDRDLVATWEALDAAQRVHEQGHVEIARSWLTCIEEAAADQETCAGAAETIHRVMGAMEREQEAYDRRTRHGVRQGSVL